MFPAHRESRQNKGNILKASVDYIKSLQDDQRRLAQVTEQKRKTESDLRKVLITLNVSCEGNFMGDDDNEDGR